MAIRPSPLIAYSDLDLETRVKIEELLTEKQLVAFRLTIAGYGQRRVATILGISRQSARDRIDAADRRLRSARIYLGVIPAATEVPRD